MPVQLRKPAVPLAKRFVFSTRAVKVDFQRAVEGRLPFDAQFAGDSVMVVSFENCWYTIPFRLNPTYGRLHEVQPEDQLRQYMNRRGFTISTLYRVGGKET